MYGWILIKHHKHLGYTQDSTDSEVSIVLFIVLNANFEYIVAVASHFSRK